MMGAKELFVSIYSLCQIKLLNGACLSNDFSIKVKYLLILIFLN